MRRLKWSSTYKLYALKYNQNLSSFRQNLLNRIARKVSTMCSLDSAELYQSLNEVSAEFHLSLEEIGRLGIILESHSQNLSTTTINFIYMAAYISKCPSGSRHNVYSKRIQSIIKPFTRLLLEYQLSNMQITDIDISNKLEGLMHFSNQNLI